MRCVVCADTDAEQDEEFGAALCDSCYGRIQDYPDAERRELIEGLRAAVGVKAPAELPPRDRSAGAMLPDWARRRSDAAWALIDEPPHIEYFPERKDGPIDL